MRKRNKSGNNSSPIRIRAYQSLPERNCYLGDHDIFGKVNKNDGALLADLKRGIRRWCEPDIKHYFDYQYAKIQPYTLYLLGAIFYVFAR